MRKTTPNLMGCILQKGRLNNMMEISYVNTQKGRKEFLDAVDTVCINCHYCKEEVCDTCPVRKTCDELPEVQK